METLHLAAAFWVGLGYAASWVGFLLLGRRWKRWEAEWETALCQLHPEGKEGLASLLDMGVQFFVHHVVGYWQAKSFLGLSAEFVRWSGSSNELYNNPLSLYDQGCYPLMTWFWTELARLLENVEEADRSWWKPTYLEFLHNLLSPSLVSRGSSLDDFRRRLIVLIIRALGKIGNAQSKTWLELLSYVQDQDLKQAVQDSIASLDIYFKAQSSKELLRARPDDSAELLHAADVEGEGINLLRPSEPPERG